MVRGALNKSNVNLDSLTLRIITQERITTQEHLQITTAILNDYQLTEETRRCINQIFEQIQEKRIQIV